MSKVDLDKPVIVGIDGSKSALQAALWAAEEAIYRDCTLQLLHVVEPGRTDHEKAMAEARSMLDVVWEAVETSGKPVKLETFIAHGEAARCLVEASHAAAVVCVGHRGAHDSPPGKRGATARTVALSASSTVTVVRHRKDASPFHQWVLVVLDESSTSSQVWRDALAEATVRHAPVLALTSWSTNDSHRHERRVGVRKTLDRFIRGASDSELRVCALPMPNDILHIVSQSASIDQLLVVGADKRDVVRQLLTPKATKIMRRSNCSLMFVRADVEH